MSDDDKAEKYQEILDIEDRRSALIGELLDYNQRITRVLRDQAKDWEMIALAYTRGNQACLEIAELSAVQARLSADITGDLISAEFGVVEVEEIDDEDEDLDDIEG